jgi:2-C-methyl-D-erythritol 4-phosphate cytidylyltransferase
LTEKGHIENVLIHDAARPCVLNEEVEEFLTQFCSSENSGAIFATPCSDTLKASSDGVRINQTVDRSELWQAQTPQVFRHTNLMQAYEVNKIEMNKLTDESSLFDKLDDDIFLFQSSANNIKITFQEDLRLAESIINIKRN